MGRLVTPDSEDEEGVPQTRILPFYGSLVKQAVKMVPATLTAAGEANDEALALANTYRPSSMAVSFLVEVPSGAKLLFQLLAVATIQVNFSVAERERTWWLRSPAVLETEVSSEELLKQVRCKGTRISATNIDGITLDFEVLSRPYGTHPQQRLLTVALVNRTPNDQSADRYGLFQATFEGRIVSPTGSWHILPYPRAAEMGIRDDTLMKDEEEASIALLYRNTATYAIGHGFAADWVHDPRRNRAQSVSAVPLPVFETPSVTPDIKDAKGNKITVWMAALAGLMPDDDGFGSLERIITLYEHWIVLREREATDLDLEEYRLAAFRHINACQVAARRMRAGLVYLRSDPLAFKAFQLANHAILAQQARSRPEPRRAIFDSQSHQFVFDEAYPEPDLLDLRDRPGKLQSFSK